MDDRTLSDLIDSAMRHRRGEGPPPDLTALDLADQEEGIDVVRLVEALVFSKLRDGDKERFLERIRSFQTADAQAAIEPVVDALVARHGGAVTVRSFDNARAVSGMPPLFLCSAMAERVLVVGVGAVGSDAAMVRPLFDDDPGLTAVMLYEPASGQAALIDNAACRRRLVPGQGFVDPSPLAWRDPASLLHLRFDEVIPPWESIDRLDTGLALGSRIDEAVREVVIDAISAVDRSRPQLAHKRAARSFALEVDRAEFVALTNDVRGRRASPSASVERVIALCKDGAP
jgi:hypothetical protein